MNRRICIISEVCSDNLGDQAIYRALVEILQPHYFISNASFGKVLSESSVVERKETRAGWLRLPIPFELQPKSKALIRWHALGNRNKFRRHYGEAIEGNSLIVIGGGQLVKNNTSLFCEKVALIASICKRKSLPFAFLGVGVDERLSQMNWRFVKCAIQNAQVAIFRDQISLRRVLKRFGPVGNFSTLPDFGFSLLNPSRTNDWSRREVVLAINAMDSSALNKRFGGTHENCRKSFSFSLCNFIKDSGFVRERIVLFTTGSHEDFLAAKEMSRDIYVQTGVKVEIFHPETLDDLLYFLSLVRNVIATRMHAGILAYVSGCNPLCLSWDDKIDGVWQNISQERRVIPFNKFISKNEISEFVCLLRELCAPSPAELDVLSLRIKQGVLESVGDIFDNYANKAKQAQ
jgi:polysaccharide pyruvyl transferase WcaK-like protein